MKRVVILSDGHLGHRFGLCPPEWLDLAGDRKLSTQVWDWLKKLAQTLKPVHVLVANGDMIDGVGSLSGGVECITTDRLRQAEMAVKVLQMFRAAHTFVVSGTPYHTGAAEEFEKPIADALGGDFGPDAFFRVDKIAIHCRHHITMGQTPQGRASALIKAQVMDALAWAVGPGGERADVLVRSQVHQFWAVHNDFGAAFVTDGLQIGSRVGKVLDNWLDLGVLSFDITGEDLTWRRHRFTSPLLGRKAQRL